MTAAFHKKLAPELAKDLAATRKEVEQWSLTGYGEALAKGARLSAEERRSTAGRLAHYTGLSADFVENNNLRVPLFRFNKELLRDRRRTVGRLDSRFTGMDEVAATDTPEFDPSLTAIRPPYTSSFAHYVRNELGYKSDLEYFILGGGIARWDMDADNRFADTSDALRSAFAKNPHMKLFVASGYYDMATPYFATQWTLDHLGLDPSLRANITIAEYDAGHMMYIHERELEKLKRHAAAFIEKALQ
jgi:carboxypeptidase C (cathepsin A)